MKTINSLSGGKTSSYMALNFPADYEIFSLVTIDDVRCKPKDNALVKFVSNKIDKEFIATAEDDLTLKVIIDLEQLLGREIIWVSGKSFDSVIKKASIVPNSLMRFCTTEMKIRPIFDWWYKNIGEKVKMGIGYRYDEIERVERFTTTFKGIIGKIGKKNKWETIEWREGYFPLVENRINHFHVINWANKSGLNFPNDSNCVGCFHKNPQQLRKNWDDNNNKMQWFAEKETLKTKFRQDGTYLEFKKLALQLDFNFGTGSGCNGGFCTD